MASPRFDYRSLSNLAAGLAELGVDLPLDSDLSPLGQPVAIGDLRAPNALGIQPMEGCDNTADGAPGELAYRRYERFARGGAGLIWFEAIAVVDEGRSSERQLWLTEANLAAHAGLVDRTRGVAREAFGASHRPVLIAQLTHSGYRSRANGRYAPVIASRIPARDLRMKIPPDLPIITDDQLERLEDEFVKAARLAWRAGYDGVDIKACHDYLGAELLGAHTRSGRYGGSFENRTRFLLNVVEKVRDAVPELLLAVRASAFDSHPYPHGWARNPGAPSEIDPTDPVRLARLLYEKGARLLNLAGYLSDPPTQTGRPTAEGLPGIVLGGNHPFWGLSALLRMAKIVQEAVPDLVVMNTGYSRLRQFFPNAAAAHRRLGWMGIAGLGRGALAYPDFARDILERGALDPQKVCTTCDSCGSLLWSGGIVGCVTRDGEVYLPAFRESRKVLR